MVETKKKRLRIVLSLINCLIIIPAVLVIGIFLGDRNYAVTSGIIVVLALVPFFLLFENKKMKARELVPIAIMTALAIVGRMAFYFVPQFKPIVAIVIIAGIAFGSEAGFLSGSLAILCSNIFFGQGPWTPWQMFACGLIGYISGFLGKRDFTKKLIIICLWGFVACILYGLCVDMWAVMGVSPTFELEALIAAYTLSLPFNLILAGATVIFLAILAKPLLEKLERIKVKYGLIAATQGATVNIDELKTKTVTGFEKKNDDK